MLKNVLHQSASPYLRQHSDNPVHWQMWGAEALEEAEKSGKPILLSIGYAACHWCHVMAHESFEDDETAAVMNELFVNIKVDREERSDIDQIYMAALQATGEQGGWPLTMFLNSKGEPFWGGTYFPKTANFGRPGFVTVLKTISELYRNDPDKIERNAEAIGKHLKQQFSASTSPESPDREVLANQSKGILSIYDARHGGIGQSPKFPNATMLETLWRNWRTNGATASRDAALHWIKAMINGGIYDHIGGGLSRYAVDNAWLVPHFEKMLYDNAQLIRSLIWAYAQTEEDLFRSRIEETVDWLEREMLLPNGGFSSSLDADSEGEEGRYYVWRKEEVDTVLGTDTDLFCDRYDITTAGNWEGKNIPNLKPDAEAPTTEEILRLSFARKKLFQAREERVRPERDDKVLADWNGLVIRALAEASRTLSDARYLRLAENAYDFVSESMSDNDGRLAHAWRESAMTWPALASDYGAMINAATSLYLCTNKGRYIEDARRWADILEEWYSDGEGGYFYSASDCNDILLRARHEHDDAMPSASAQIIEGLARLACLTNDPELTLRTTYSAAASWGRVRTTPLAASGIVNAIATALEPRKLIVLNPTKQIVDLIIGQPDPSRMDITLMDETDAQEFLPADAVYESGEGSGRAYLCKGAVCLPPVETVEELAALLSPPESSGVH
ncbi:thioredoxin domain-containing protein [Hoeflea sp. WL0058]|uniref:Thioredoxin domain-containing protein n=2 Tax=Flavimaribacter sediminis TaxID=2865987 RepID=A0AAE3D108_9HYPH|nr:thioredoxin domain-containing protein [Flavimaribacter sediminis]